MKHKKMKYLLCVLASVISVHSYASNTVELSERESLNIEPNDYFQHARYSIWFPGSDTWIDNGKVYVTEKMPACLIVLSDALDEKQLEKFISDIDVTTYAGRKLPLESFKGTLTYVDRDPFNMHTDTHYDIKTKDNLTFGQLLQSVGGTEKSRVSIFFDRGCAKLAVRPYLPNEANTSVAAAKVKFYSATKTKKA